MVGCDFLTGLGSIAFVQGTVEVGRQINLAVGRLGRTRRDSVPGKEDFLCLLVTAEQPRENSAEPLTPAGMATA